MNDMNRWQKLFGKAGPGIPADTESEIEAVRREEAQPQPSDDHAITITIQSGGDHEPFETGLRGTWTESGGFVVPFASVSNAVDCLRMVLRDLERENEA